MRRAPLTLRMERTLTRAIRRLLQYRVASLRTPDDLREMTEWFIKRTNEVEGRLRQLSVQHPTLPGITSFDGSEALRSSILLPEPPWAGVEASRCDIPGMLRDQERQYYEYIGRFFSGTGEVVEIGSWLGCSTHHIVHGLLGNPRFASRRLWVFDAFIWAAYMADFYPRNDPPK